MRFTLRVRILSGFLVMIALIAGLGVGSILSVQRVQGLLAATYQKDLTGLNESAETLAQLHNLRVGAHRYVGAPTPERGARIASTLDGDLTDFKKMLVSLEQLDAVKEGQVSLSTFNTETEAFIGIVRQAMVQKQTRGAAEAAWLLERDGRDRFLKAEEAIQQLHDRIQADAKARYEASVQDAQRSLALTLGFIVVALGAALAMAWVLARSIVNPIQRMQIAAQAIARGELDQDVREARQDELGDMAQSFQEMTGYLKEVAHVASAMSDGDLSRSLTPKSERDRLGTAVAHMIESLRDMVQRVRAASDAVEAEAHQIAGSSTELSASVALQASSAEETSAAMEEMAANLQSVDATVQTMDRKVSLVRAESDALGAAVTQTSSSISELAASIQQVAGNVSNANRVAGEASEAANAGETAVSQTVAGMKAIAETMGGIRKTIQVLDQRSSEIGAIIEVIDDIAEQTNLLALNAAIEAARAGEAGRGFAVVADEVRKLAERSARATKEIGDLIKGIQAETAQAVHVTQEGATKVEEGSKLASHTGEALGRIRTAAVQVTQLLGEVVAATDEQARAGSQIVAATEQMATINDHVTGAVAEMEQLAKSVSYATAEQRQGSEQVVLAVDSLNRSSREAAGATEQVARTADDLTEQARRLQEAVAFFKLTASARPTAPGAERPLALSASRPSR
ncbi:HAMP domain-containing protein [bacterium]|nr:HAMP domain-containing protein [bacterium]